MYANDDNELLSEDGATMPSLESVEQPEEEGNVDGNANDDEEAPPQNVVDVEDDESSNDLSMPPLEEQYFNGDDNKVQEDWRL